jgi:DNA-binding transcriptional ArsR family regulator
LVESGRLDRAKPQLDNRIVTEHFGYEMTPSERLDATFLALADPTRRAILGRLAEGEASVAELAAPFSMSQPAISKHLKMLERAGLITSGRDATRRPRKIEAAPLSDAAGWIERFRSLWEGRYARLDGLLSELKGEAGPKGTR